MIALVMGTKEQYHLGGDGTGRYYCVLRKCDNSKAGYIRRTEEGWKLLDPQEIYYDNVPAFTTDRSAALFLQMRGRVYKATIGVPINLVGAPESIQIRVSPNFGQWYAAGCLPGQWAASLHHEDGRDAGSTRCAISIEEAKVDGVHRAYNGALALELARLRSEQLAWQEGPVPACSATPKT